MTSTAMLRWIVLAALLANLAYWAWGRGTLSGLGLVPTAERDTARLQQQQRPELVRVLSPNAVPAPRSTPTGPAAVPADAPVTASSSCFESAPLAATAIDAAEQAAAGALPPGAVTRVTHTLPAEHVVAIGPLSSRDAVRKKVEEIDRLRLPHEAAKLPGDREASHLLLGRYDSAAAAQAALLGFSQKGVRTARVVLTREAGNELRLRVDAASAEQAEALRALKHPALGDAGFAPCAGK
jgi:hypothetical protein